MSGNHAIIWAESDGAADLAGIVRDAGATLAAVGGPDPKGIRAALDDPEITVFDDLRATVMAEKPSVVLVTTGHGSGPAALDGRTVSQLRAAGTSILTTTAPAPGLIEAGETGLFRESGGTTPSEGVRLVPRVRRHASYRAAEDVFADYGRADLVTIEAFSPRAFGGASAALLTALDAVQTMVGVPELVDAAAARPTKRLGELSGSAAALLRFADGRCGQLLVSDQAKWGWRITMGGDAGRLTIRPSGFDWIGADGAVRDSSRCEEANAQYAGVIRAAIERALEGSGSGEPTTDWVSLLASAEAVLLSSRTGQPESPATIARAAEMPSV